MASVVSKILRGATWAPPAFALLLSSVAAHAQTTPTTFTYQGRLEESRVPVTGARDFQFKLYDGAGAQVGPTLTVEDVSVEGGAFTVYLDFGNVFDGAERRLEVGVRPGASVGAFTARRSTAERHRFSRAVVSEDDEKMCRCSLKSSTRRRSSSLRRRVER